MQSVENVLNKRTMKRQYTRPTIEFVEIEIDSHLLATSLKDVDIKDQEGTEVLSKEENPTIDLWAEEEDGGLW